MARPCRDPTAGLRVRTALWRAVPPGLGVLLSAALLVMAFPPVDAGGLALVALVPLLLAAHGRPARATFALGYAWGVLAFGGVLWWLVTFGPAAWLLAALFMAVFPAVVMGTITWSGGGRAPDILRIPALWTAVEFLRSQGPLGFPWALLGESQHRALEISQIASATAVYGVSFLIVLVNAALYLLLVRRANLRTVVVAATAVAAAFAWGAAVMRAPVPATFVAAVVQPDYATRTSFDPSRVVPELAVLDALTRDAAGRGAALVVWPETASPTDIPGNPVTLARIRSWVRQDNLSLLASSLEGGRTNSVFSFAPDGTLTGRYDKIRLVPFAEEGEQAGHGPVVLRTPPAAIGVAICFESVFPEIARRSVVEGAGLLAVVTNDAWFDGTTAPLQHAAIAPFRAIEEGRYLLRAANSGPSLIIDPHGRVRASLPLGVRGVLTARVAPRATLTLYARVGDVFGWGIALLGAALLVPRAVAFLVEAQGPALIRLLASSALPLAVLVAARALVVAAGIPEFTVAGARVPLPILAVLAVVLLLSLRRSPRDLGLAATGFIPAAAAGLAVVAGLTAVAVIGFSSHGPPPSLLPPPGGWWLGGAAAILVSGLAFEWWLRGLVFAAAAAWRGWRVGVVWSAVLGTAAAAPRGAEAMVWALCSGLAFGLIRARWAQVPALAVAHGAGDVLLAFVIPSA
ncbi:MAG TPA: apolipoprotein N-acyltransferase [bacterium]|nr:apolipoprotein N-acyltransferase [bacterium]